MITPVISFQDYGFQYTAQAEPTLHHINLDIYPGEKVLIAGTSGSGKSTIGNCINGLIPFAYPGKSTGRLLVDGKEAKESSIFELSHVVGTVLQDTDGITGYGRPVYRIDSRRRHCFRTGECLCASGGNEAVGRTSGRLGGY